MKLTTEPMEKPTTETKGGTDQKDNGERMKTRIPSDSGRIPSDNGRIPSDNGESKKPKPKKLNPMTMEMRLKRGL